MKTPLHILVLLCLTTGVTHAQGETDNWQFGSFAGLNFSTGAPVALPMTSIFTTEGSASISDSAGNLLFYTEGMTVYNSNDQVMPNGTGLLGDISSTQSAVIVKKPQSSTEYFLFTVDEDGGPDGLRYSVVDMTLQGGLGDVTATKNVFLRNHLTEKLCAVNATENEEVWIATHGFGSNSFYCYKVKSTGIDTTPVISSVGTIHDSSQIQNAYGYMKFSPDGAKLAAALGYLDKIEIFDFDNGSGTLSNPVTLTLGEHVYGIEFSPNRRYLYATEYSNITQVFHLVQYDLSAGNAAAIMSSKVMLLEVFSPDEVRALQLAKDGKIYLARNYSGLLDVIDLPDSAGFGSSVYTMSVSLAGNSTGLGLPNFNASFFSGLFPPVAGFTGSDTICANSCVSFSDNSANQPTSWQWSFPGATTATSALKNPSNICYTTPGVYDIKLVVSNSKGTDSVTITNAIIVVPAPPVPVITANGAMLSSSAGTSYQWYLGNASIAGATGQTYEATQSGDYSVVVSNADSCAATSAITNVVVTGIAGVEAETDAMYPNPATEQVTIRLSDALIPTAKVNLRSINGQLLSETILPATNLKQFTLPLQNLTPGIYIVELVAENGQRIAKQLVKRSL